MKNDLWRKPDRRASQIDRHVGQRIKLRRRTLKLTQMDLAEALEVDVKEVSMLETGVRRASAGSLFVLCNLMGVSPEWFFKGIGEAPADPANDDDPVDETSPCEELIGLVQSSNDEDLCREILRFARLLIKRSEAGESEQSPRELEC